MHMQSLRWGWGGEDRYGLCKDCLLPTVKYSPRCGLIHFRLSHMVIIYLKWKQENYEKTPCTVSETMQAGIHSEDLYSHTV